MKDRTLKALPQTLVYRTSMVVTSATDQARIKAKIPEDSSEYTLLNKTGMILVVGDSIVVESNGTSLNNGLVVYKFGADAINFEQSLGDIAAALDIIVGGA